MVKKKIFYFGTVGLLLFMGCSSKELTINSFKMDIEKSNITVKVLNRRLVKKECPFPKNKILKIQEESHSQINKVLNLNNLLSYSDFSLREREEIEKSLDKVLTNLFLLRQKSKVELLKVNRLMDSGMTRQKIALLCGKRIKPTPKKKACKNCRADFN